MQKKTPNVANTDTKG